MKAVILCAGYATRLYPLTLDRPKPLLPIRNRAVLDYIIDRLPKSVNKTFVVSTDKFYKDFLEWGKDKKEVTILNDGTSTNETRLGGIGDLWLAIEKEKIDEDILVILGDNLFDFNLDEFSEFAAKINETAIGVCEVNGDDIRKFGVVEISGSKIVSFEEKPEKPRSNLASTGIYFFTRKDLARIRDYMKTNEPKDGPGYLIKYFYARYGVHAFALKGRWFDIGSKETYYKLNETW
ncbi:MAG: nucleotidyltransferase family protein [Candidatus Nanoarchaeia archaeon]|nr:nucleotidyltransferase family protein [Candidatus Nanoarchaeia archaeon]